MDYPLVDHYFFMAKTFWASVKQAFQQKQVESSTPGLMYRMNSECGNEVEDEMLPWETDIEDFDNPTSILITQ